MILPLAASLLLAPMDELELIPGSLVLAGTGEIGAGTRSAFLDLLGGEGRIVVLTASNRSTGDVDWGAASATRVERLPIRRPDALRTEEALEALLQADGIWIEELPDKVVEAPLARTLVVAALERGAVVGGAGEAARQLAGAEHLGLVPRLFFEFGASDAGSEDTHHHVGRENPGRLVAAMPDSSALVVFGGRKVALVGDGDVGFAVYREGEVMADESVLPCNADRDPGDPLRSRLDLLSWVRQARAAEKEIYPPKTPGAPRVEKGALIVQGGGGVTDPTWDRFIELAGGEDASFVCIPSASEMDDDAAPRSYSARELEERGCSNVRILHAADRRTAARLAAAIAGADAVWIDGGRTFRFMDRFGETHAASALGHVLDRGGVVGGSSAGCQVIGDLLVRGNPRTNSDMTDAGYLQGLGLLQGVVLDAHFRERDRFGELRRLVGEYPQMLGIGVDAGAALLVRGSVAEVLGESGVNVYDQRRGDAPPEKGLALEPGDRIDLITGKPLD